MPPDASKPPGDLAALFARVARRYRGSGRLVQGYVAGKLRRDPVNRAVLALAAQGGFGDVIDIGCGRGQLGIALLEAGLARSVLGLDASAAHVDQAGRAGTGLAYRAVVQDIARAPGLPAATTVLLVDVLYQLDAAVQVAVLRAAALVARRVIVRTLDPGRGMRSALTLGVERLGRRLLPHSGARVNPLPVGDLAAVLAGTGMAVTVTPCWHGTPFANVLISATRE